MATIETRKGKNSTTYRVKIRRKGQADLCQSFPTEREAKEWATNTEADLNRGIISAAKEFIKTTFADLITRYLKDVTPKNDSADREEKMLLAFMRDYPFVNKPLNEITIEDFDSYRHSRIKIGNKEATIKKNLKKMAAIYNYANKFWKVPNKFPAKAVIEDLSDGKPRNRRPTSQEWELLISTFNRISYEFSVFLQVLASSCMRRSELCLLTRDRLVNGYVFLPDTKNGDDRLFGLMPDMVELLEQLPVREDGRFFSFSPDTATNKFGNVCKVLGIKDLRIHDLRHEGISQLAEMGMSDLVIREISGHKTTRMLQRYVNLRPETVRDEMMRLRAEHQQRKAAA